MIFDTDKNLRLYAQLNPAFEAIAKFIEENDMKAMECGSYEVESMYLSRQRFV